MSLRIQRILRLIQCLGLCLITCSTAQAAAPAPPKEPTAGGKRLGDLLMDLDPNTPAQLALPFRQFGSNAIPFLLYVVGQTNLSVRNSPLVLRVWRKAGVRPTPAMLNQIRERAARAIGEVASNSSFAVPSIVALLPDDDFVVSQNLAASLGRVAPKDTNALTALASLSSQLATAYPEASNSLPSTSSSALASQSQQAIFALISLASATNVLPPVRGECLVALAEIGSESPDMVPSLVRVFSKEAPKVRAALVSSAVRFGPSAIPLLLAAARDADASTRRSAAAGIAMRAVFLRSCITNADLVASMATCCKDVDGRVRANAVSALAFLHPIEEPSITSLATALSDPDSQVQWAAIQSLRTLGPRAISAVPALRRLANENALMRDTAVHAIQQIEGKLAPP